MLTVAALLALWLVWYLVQPVLLRHRASAEAAVGVQAQRSGFEAAMANDAAALEPVLGTASAVRFGYICEVVHDDQGWIVQQWRQQCSLRALSVYPVTAALTALESQIAALPDAQARFGTRWKGGAHACISLFNRAQDGAAVAYRDSSCEPLRPDPSNGFASVDWSSFPAGVPAATAPYVLVTRTERVSNTELGCAPLPVFCQAPFEQPVI